MQQRTDTRICTGVLLSRPYQSYQELHRQEKSKSNRGILKSKGFESWIGEWSSFPICFKFIVANEEVDSGLNEHVGPEGSLDISITFRSGYQGTISKLTLSLSSMYKWAIQSDMARGGKCWALSGWQTCCLGSQTTESFLSVWLVGAPAGRADSSRTGPSCWLLHKCVCFFCFVADVGCGQSFSVGLWIQDLQVHLLSNI